MTRPSLRTALVLVLAASALALGACSAGAPDAQAPSASESPSTEPSDAAPDGDCPEPPADAPTGAVDDPYNLGDEIVLGCFTVTVDEVVTDATDAVMEANPSAEPADGNVYATVTLTVTRTSGAPADVSEVTPIMAGSMTTSGDPTPDLVVGAPPPSGEIAVGESVTGTFIYEVSGGASLSLEFDRDGETVNVLPY